MRVHDEALLWGYAAHELDAEAVAVLEDHLPTCPECRDRLDQVRATRLLLRTASGAAPALRWSRVDDGVERLVSLAVVRSSRRRPVWRWAGAVVAVAVAAALAALYVAPRFEVPLRSEPIVIDVPLVPEASSLLAATDASAGGAPVAPGQSVRPGQRLATGGQGSLSLVLPDASRVRLLADGRLTLVRTRPQEVELRLEAGTLVARASHRAQRRFLVRAGEVDVRVLGTAFAMESTPVGVEVAVVEGRVLAETARGESVLVREGERVRFDARGRLLSREALGSAYADGFREVGVDVTGSAGARSTPGEELTTRARARPVDAAAQASGGRAASTPGAAAATGATSPRSAPWSFGEAPAAVLQAGESPTVSAPADEARVEAGPVAPGEPATTRAGGSAAAPTGAGGGAGELEGGRLPEDLEGLMLWRAEQSLRSGTCARHLPALLEVATSAEVAERRGFARVLRARCYDQRLMPRDAEREYVLYLAAFPHGRWASEAAAVVGH